MPSQKMDDAQPPGILIENGEIKFGIDKILDSRTKIFGKGKRKESLVKWTGYAKPTWHTDIDFEDTLAFDLFKKGN